MRSPWDVFRFLETEPTARSFLTDAYTLLGVERPERAAFMQSNRLLYAWKQARTCYDAAARAELLIRPLLCFYGCVSLLKGAVIARDPSYPQNSRVLQHGVTTRKIKRHPYRLLDDEVRLQKEGFLRHASRVLYGGVLRDSYTVKELFSFVPDLSDVMRRLSGASDWQPVSLSDTPFTVSLPPSRGGTLAYSDETLLRYLNRLAPAGLSFQLLPSENGDKSGAKRAFLLVTEGGLSLADHPLFAAWDGTCAFWSGPEETLPPPAWFTHFLLLYQLSMLCRYETELWGELVLSHMMAEVYLVDRFLAVHQTVFPRLVASLLPGQNPRP